MATSPATRRHQMACGGRGSDSGRGDGGSLAPTSIGHMRMASRMAAAACFVLALGAGQCLASESALHTYLARFVDDARLPGAVLAVTSPAGTVVATAGVAQVASNEPVRPDTRFYIASSGKLMTSAAVLQLEQAGKFQLKDKVVHLIEPFAGMRGIANIERVTVAHLLKHRSGLAEYYGDAFERAAQKAPNKRWSVAESLSFIVDEDANDEPGASYEYVNSNYVLLGHLIASQDRSTYEQAIRQRLIQPLGLTHTTVGARADEPNLAHGYEQTRNGRLKDVSHGGWSAVTGDGGIVTTAPDYGVFLRALFRDHKVVGKEAVRRMCTRQREEPDADYGLGCMVIRTQGGDAWGHNGSITGFNAEAWYVPKLDVSMVLLANGAYEAESADIIRQVLKALRQ